MKERSEIDESWQKIKRLIIKVTTEVIGKTYQQRISKHWFDQEDEIARITK